MTGYCERCGNQLRERAKFCHSCGAGTTAKPVAAPSQSAYQPQNYPQSPQAWTPAHVEPRPKSSNTAKIIIFTLISIIALVGVLGIGAFFFVRRAVQNVVSVSEDASGRPQVAIKPPGGGEVKIASGSSVTEEQLGVPIYPGSTPSKEGGSLSISGRDLKGEKDGGGWIGVATFTTGDSLDEVVTFYRAQLDRNVRTFDTTVDGKRTVVFNANIERGMRSITITEDTDATKITIAGMVSRPAPGEK